MEVNSQIAKLQEEIKENEAEISKLWNRRGEEYPTQ